MADNLTLASEFETPSKEQWLAAVDKVLKGKDFDRVLVSELTDGIRINPLYTADDVATEHDESGFPAFAPLTRGQRLATNPDGAWDIRTTITHPHPATANTQALEDLANGATSVELVLDLGAQGGGIACRSAADLAAALDGVHLDAAAVSLRAGAYGAVAADWLESAQVAAGIDRSQAMGCLGIDPLGSLAADGVLPQGYEQALAGAVARAARASNETPQVRALLATGTPAANAGASEAQELAFVLAAATTYLRSLVEAGLDVNRAAAQIELELTADVDIFATVAKFRALRQTWEHVLTTAGATLTPETVRLSAVSSWRTWTVTDPWVNLLRGTAATAGATLGGADAITIEPFDAAVAPGGPLGRRMARNTQLVLAQESGLGRVLDPTGGSWYIESLTDSIARAGWSQFQQIEAEGGLFAALRSGSFAAKVAEVAATRALEIASRKHPITGTSEFPLLDERRPEAVPVPLIEYGPAVDLSGEPTEVRALPAHRLSEPFEQLRAAADAADPKPTVFLANLGSPAAFTARATFAANLLAAGGVRNLPGDGTTDSAALADEFTKSGLTVACICSSDSMYAEHAAAAARALKRAGASRVLLAGKPGDLRESLDAAGVDEYVALGVNALDVLRRLHEELMGK